MGHRTAAVVSAALVVVLAAVLLWAEWDSRRASRRDSQLRYRLSGRIRDLRAENRELRARLARYEQRPTWPAEDVAHTAATYLTPDTAALNEQLDAIETYANTPPEDPR